MTCPEAETRVGVAGVGGEKRERDREGTAESNVGQPEAGGGSGRGAEDRSCGWAGKGADRGACTGRGSGGGAVDGVWGVTKAGAVWSGGSG